MKFLKIAERLFLINIKKKYLLVRTYPFKVVEVCADSFKEAEKTSKENIKYFNEKKKIRGFEGFYALDWIMTTGCNLDCPHCFAKKQGEEGQYGLGKNFSVTSDELKRSIDFAMCELRKGLKKSKLDQGKFEVFILGGEPLLEFDILKKAILYSRKEVKKLKEELRLKDIDETYFLATNGLLINDEHIKFFKEHPFTVSISIDTPKNPLKLDFKNERKTHIALEAVNKLVDKNFKNIVLNCVIPASKIYKLDSIMDYIEKLGFINKVSGIQITPQSPPLRQAKFSECSDDEVIISEWAKDLEKCKIFSKKLIEYSKKYKIDMKKCRFRVHSMLSQGGMSYRCPVALWKLCLVPGGEIYPCHQLVGLKKFRMGNIHDDFSKINKDMEHIKNLFRKRTVFNQKPCINCPLQSCCVVFIDCPARCYLESGNMYNVPKHQCLVGKGYLINILEEYLEKLIDKK